MKVAFLPSTKTYPLTLTRNYVSKWQLPQAVRELIQNALDSDSPFVYEFAPDEFGHWSLILRSEFTTLSPQTLLLGSTSKADTPGYIGSFGEGYKIALLVLTRLGFDVEVRNGDRLWRPRFQFDKRFGEELLVVDETDLTVPGHKGLAFVVHGLSDSDVADVRESCLQMQDHIGEIHSTTYGDILLERSGMLYVGGLFICKTELRFGYNIKPEFIKLERDRQTVDNWDLKALTRDMWIATQRYDEVARLIESGAPDLEYVQYSSTALVREACYRHFVEKHPGKIPAKNQDELKQMVAQGMERVIVVCESFASQVRGSESYRSAPIVRVQTPHQRLEAWFAKAKYHMHDDAKRSFRELLQEAKGWTLK